MRLSKLAAALNCDLLFLHAPGRDLVEEGIDRLSRETAMSLRDPSCNTQLRKDIHAMAITLDWKLSVDLFATAPVHGPAKGGRTEGQAKGGGAGEEGAANQAHGNLR